MASRVEIREHLLILMSLSSRCSAQDTRYKYCLGEQQFEGREFRLKFRMNFRRLRHKFLQASLLSPSNFCWRVKEVSQTKQKLVLVLLRNKTDNKTNQCLT